MNLRRLTTPLLAATVLLSTLLGLGCSKKDAPVSLTNTGTYTLDGVATPCQVDVKETPGTANNLIADYLDIRLTPIDPQHSGEAVLLYFDKPLNAPSSDYRLAILTYSNRNPANPFPYDVNYYGSSTASATLRQFNGGYSGTFAGTFSRFSSHVVTAGAFTDARP